MPTRRVTGTVSRVPMAHAISRRAPTRSWRCKEQDISLRRLRDAERLPAERGSQFGFERLAIRAVHRGVILRSGKSAACDQASFASDSGDQDGGGVLNMGRGV
jgi:hypothetical protein